MTAPSEIARDGLLVVRTNDGSRYPVSKSAANAIERTCSLPYWWGYEFGFQTVRIRISDRAHSSIYYREYIDYIETRKKRRSPAAHAAVVQLFLLRKEVQPVSSKYNQRSTIKRIQQLSSTNETFHRPKPNTSRSSNRHPRTVPMPPMPALSYKLTALLSSDRR